jgi:hypothetical protein
MGGAIPPLPQYAFMAWCSVKHRDNFTFTFNNILCREHISKVLEKVMYNRLNHHMQTNNILVPEKFGLSQGKSTDNAAFKLTDSVLKSVNQKMHVGGIFCDLLKAFEYVNHEILLLKLHYYGIQRTVANWFRS